MSPYTNPVGDQANRGPYSVYRKRPLRGRQKNFENFQTAESVPAPRPAIVVPLDLHAVGRNDLSRIVLLLPVSANVRIRTDMGCREMRCVMSLLSLPSSSSVRFVRSARQEFARCSPVTFPPPTASS